MNGVLVIDKPAGPTSHDVVAVVRRAIGLAARRPYRHARSAGDGRAPARHRPGDAARVVHERRRQGVRREDSLRRRRPRPTTPRSRLGATASRDGQRPRVRRARRVGHRRRRCRPSPGRYLQTPPAFSAKKVGGTPAYKLARQGKPVDVKPVEVTVTRDRAAQLRRRPGRGEAGVLERLLRPVAGARPRTASRVRRAPRGSAADAGRGVHAGRARCRSRRLRRGRGRLAVAERRLIPMERLLTHLPAVVVSELGAKRASHGSAPAARRHRRERRSRASDGRARTRPAEAS